MKKVEYPKDAYFINMAQAQKVLDQLHTRAELINELPTWRLVKHYSTKLN